MTYRIRLLFNDGKEPMLSLTRHKRPTEEDAAKGMELYKADSFEIIEEHGSEEKVIQKGKKGSDSDGN